MAQSTSSWQKSRGPVVAMRLSLGLSRLVADGAYVFLGKT